MAATLAGSCTFLVVVLAFPAVSEAACDSSCANATLGPASLFTAVLDRCRQRCRDSIGTCQQIAYHANSSCCAINVDAATCGAGWTAEARDSTFCGYGKGRPSQLASCTLCAAGTASHADVGDLAGVWSVTDPATGISGTLQVTSSGSARYGSGTVGQFVLLHPRHDENYPGAYFLQYGTSAASASPGWDYAWLEDDTEPPTLLIRQFCGLGPGQCASSTSPEGSPFFIRTLRGTLQVAAVAEADCMLLEGTGLPTGSSALGACCDAATETQNLDNVTTVYIPGVGLWQEKVVRDAAWNQGVLTHFTNASLWYDASNNLFCDSLRANALSDSSPGGAPVIAVADRGTCAFAKKAQIAHEAGAVGVFVINTGNELPANLPRPENSNNLPTPVPLWLIDRSTGDEIKAGLTQVPAYSASARVGYPDSLAGAFTEICCVASCRSRVEGAVTAGRGGGINLTAICSTLECSAPTTAAPSGVVSLPHASSSCVACPNGFISGAAGRASCALCGDGETAASNKQACEPCAANSAGTGGTCSACSSGQAPDALRRQCITAVVVPTPAPTPPPTPCPTPAPVVPTPYPAPTPEPVFTGGGGTVSTDSGGFNWGTFFGVIICIFCLAVIGWVLRRFYLSFQQTGQVDFQGTMRDFSSGVSGGANRAFSAAAGAAGVRIVRKGPENGGESAEGNEGGDSEAAGGAEPGNDAPAQKGKGKGKG